MKKNLIILSVAVFGQISHAQKNCKFEVNEFDKFAGKQTKITKKKRL